MEYTAAQRAAIGTLDDPLLIVACAGSGKLRRLSRRKNKKTVLADGRAGFRRPSGVS